MKCQLCKKKAVVICETVDNKYILCLCNEHRPILEEISKLDKICVICKANHGDRLFAPFGGISSSRQPYYACTPCVERCTKTGQMEIMGENE